MQTDISQNNYHVHEVMEMMSELKTALTLDEIKNLIEEKFGIQSTFNSCSMSDMNSTQVIEFLIGRDKIAISEPGKYQLNTNNSCGH